MRTSTSRTSGRKLISVAAVSVALVAGMTSSVAFAQAPSAKADAAPAVAGATEATPGTTAERLIVGYKSGAAEATSNKAADADATAKGKEAGESLDFQRRLGSGAALVDLGEDLTKADVADVIAEYQADPQVAYVAPDRLNKAMATPNDTEYSKQWDLSEATAGMNVPGAWDKVTGTGVTVAVIDTGYVAHSDLAANIVGGYDFIADTAVSVDGNGRDSNPADPGDWNNATECGTGVPASDSSWHGTHVAGTIAAATNNSKGIAGIAYGAKISPVRVLGKCGGYDSDIIDAITWASGGTVSGVPANTNVAKVINMSLGGGGACTTATQSAITAAVNRGTTVVVAAGNSNANAANYSPASCNNVISVAATNRAGSRSSYSNFGSVVDIAAPGGETRTAESGGILSTLNAGTKTPTSESYAYYQGTSMAAPHIAGLAALVKSANSALTPAQIESAIKTNSRALPGTCSGGCGAGLADAAKTVQAVTGGSTGGTTFTSTTAVSIPDNGAAIESSIPVTGLTGNAPSTLQVGVDITHTYRGDLVLDLVAPDGSTYRLKASSSDSADNLVTTYSVNASSEVANGTWKLRVQDVAASDTGRLNNWKLTF
ncbi:S8 family peptidase [Streptomyces europaeiscabiei]|uniref:S8 family serine peptidase n=1 Tax=Streptomyces europaeiscabiei TaxID=146819 RepID=A0ABU4NBG2_9ACTN|nr:S8 family serine peptidase [Streptomyces europaeiscabiei]MDX2523340.1 S8 family serine peptidase [Streptomyces europaeiscabiei]MDX2764234.1 S8 family serine peptidase [Streptomyces europaeiscabiei]MDX2773366.1 S8 family serine peptidase [Streptomyces europaeiscabiei]MDX3542801.1 S8 family serine peptidase [Streptomyces europaeiscabiei]MDX3550645.1 S8 family serine peptidase [Streptomyces europaeiscabiei]